MISAGPVAEQGIRALPPVDAVIDLGGRTVNLGLGTTVNSACDASVFNRFLARHMYTPASDTETLGMDMPPLLIKCCRGSDAIDFDHVITGGG